MNTSPEKERASTYLFVVCFLMYTIICFTKYNYTASIAYIVNAGIFSKTHSGLISAAFYLFYGLGQLFGGGLADRFSPYKVISLGILGSVIANLILSFTSEFSWVLVVWSLCGLIQFGIWPGVSKIVAGVLIPEHRQKAGVYIVLCIGIGGVLSYLFATPIIEFLGWSGVFGFNTLILLLTLLVWQYTEKKTQKLLYTAPLKRQKQPAVKSDTAFLPLFFKSGLVLIVVVNFIVNMLSIGLKSWVPTMMMESYGISPAWANMQTMVIYIANIVGTFGVVYLFNKMRNEAKIDGLAMLVCLPMYFIILFIGRLPQWSMILSMIVATTVLYAIGNINVRVSNAYEPYGYSATASGMLNALASFGIVLANGGFGYLAEHFGWNSVTVLLFASCAAAVLLCIPAGFLWRKFKHENPA